MWERYSGLVLFDLGFAWFGFFTFDLHSSGTLFQARNNCVRKQKKPSSLKQENGLESGADSQRPFSKQKSRDSWGFRAPKIPADSHMIIF